MTETCVLISVAKAAIDAAEHAGHEPLETTQANADRVMTRLCQWRDPHIRKFFNDGIPFDGQELCVEAALLIDAIFRMVRARGEVLGLQAAIVKAHIDLVRFEISILQNRTGEEPG